MRKKVLVLFAIVCCIVMALGVFVACNDGDGTGGDGAGDSIFNEGTSLDDVLTALENAESFSVLSTVKSSSLQEELIESYGNNMEFSNNAILRTYWYNSTEYGDQGVYQYITYEYRSSGFDYAIDAECDENGMIYAEGAEKSLETIRQNYYANVRNNIIADIIESLLTSDADGNVTVDINAIEDEYFSYVENTAYVNLNGKSIEFGYTVRFDDSVSQEVSYLISGVNTTTVEIPDEVRALEAEAEWSDYVNYNGVTYRKTIDADGSAYYVVTSAPADAVIEETINTLPVRR